VRENKEVPGFQGRSDQRVLSKKRRRGHPGKGKEETIEARDFWGGKRIASKTVRSASGLEGGKSQVSGQDRQAFYRTGGRKGWGLKGEEKRIFDLLVPRDPEITDGGHLGIACLKVYMNEENKSIQSHGARLITGFGERVILN